jgi:hypothetical protein
MGQSDRSLAKNGLMTGNLMKAHLAGDSRIVSQHSMLNKLFVGFGHHRSIARWLADRNKVQIR